MRNPESTRKLIISKAMSIFNTKGYRATSLSDITKATGITKGAIYGNFENKDDVALAAFEYGINKIIDQLRERISAQKTAPLKLKAIIHYYEEYVLNPPIRGGCPIINTSIEADDNYPMLRTRVIRTITILKDSIKKIIHRGVIEEQVDRSIRVDEFATMFYATIEGAIMLSRVEGDLESYRLATKQLLNLIDSYSL